MEEGQKGLNKSAAAATAGRNSKVTAAATASSGGRGSSLEAAPFSVVRRCGAPAGLFPVHRGSVPPAPLFSMAPSSATATSHGGGTSSTAAGFAFPSSQSPAFWDSADATWDEDTQGLMRYFGSQAHNLVGAPSPHSNVSTPVHENNGGSSPSEQQGNPITVNVEEEDVRVEKRILWTPKEDERLMNAWIENSTDSSTGADRKGEAYWGDVRRLSIWPCFDEDF